MPIALLLPNYLLWHYTKGLRELLQNWGHVLYFTVNYFSIPNLLMTLSSPWKRMDEGAQQTINPSAILEHVIFNTLMRAVGFVLRLLTISIGLVTTAGVILAGVGLLLVWLAMPLALIVLVFAGVSFIIRPTI